VVKKTAKRTKSAKKDPTNAQRQRRYIKKLKDAAEWTPIERQTFFYLAKIGEELGHIRSVMVAFLNQMTMPAPNSIMEKFAEHQNQQYQQYMSGRWKRRDGDGIQSSEPPPNPADFEVKNDDNPTGAV